MTNINEIDYETHQKLALKIGEEVLGAWTRLAKHPIPHQSEYQTLAEQAAVSPAYGEIENIFLTEEGETIILEIASKVRFHIPRTKALTPSTPLTDE